MNKNLKKLISTVAALAITATSAFTAFAANFSDVADTADYKVAVDNLVALGIVNGYEDGTFGPEKEITRAEASKMIVGTMGPAMMDAAEASKGSSNFTDVAGDHWASGFIAQGVSKGYINGMGDGTFAPNANVTYAQVVKMLVCVLGYAEDAEANGGWPNGYINQGTTLEVTDGVSVASADTAVNRGQVAMLINNALNVPIKGIEGYEQGFKMVDGQLVPTPVPVTEVYNGKGDSGKYETLLTTYFDAYAVRGRIVETAEKGKGVVSYKIEFAENFDDEVNVYTGKKDSDGDIATTTIEAYFPADVDVDALLCSYTDAIVMENEDGDWELISVTSYGKNEVATLASELYKDDTYVDADVIEFYKSETSSKTDEYELDEDVAMYVNGVEVDTKAEREAAVQKYIADNATTEVKLVNTPKAGSKTIDSKYDYIMLSVYTSAVVDEVMVEEDEATIYVDCQNSNIIDSAEIVIDLEAIAEGEAECVVTDVDGNEVKLEDLVYNDVITIYADFESEDPYADFVNIVVAKNVKEGKVSEEDDNNKKYAIGGEFYGFAHDPEKLSVGDDYTLYLDKFNKIVKFEKTTSSINYGVINRVWENSNGEKVVRLLTADGSVVTYEFNKADDYADWKEEYEDYAAKALTDVMTEEVVVKDAEGNEVKEEREFYVFEKVMVSYKVNGSDKIYAVKNVQEDGFSLVEGEFNERQNKVSSAKMNPEVTKILDMSKVVDKWTESLSGKVAAGTVESFVDGENYKVIYGGEKNTDGTFPFVVVIEGEASISPASAFAVVKSTGRSVNEADGITYASAVVLEGKEEKTVFFENDTVDVARGDVFVYSTNNEGLVEDGEYEVLFKADASIKFADVAAYAKDKYATKSADYATSLYFKESGVDSWDDLTRTERYARVGYGVLVDKTTGDITVGKLEQNADEEWQTSFYDEIDLANDVNVYVYDQGKLPSERLSVGSTGSLTATKIARTFYETANENVYQWEAAGKDAVKTVFFKTYEDEITDIVVVVPED